MILSISPSMSKTDEKLWKRYRAGDREAYEELVEQHLYLVKVTVGRIAINIPSYVSRDELLSAGSFGLLKAIELYDPDKEAKFTTYAITRIRGEILDELRRHDTLGRVTRDRVKRIAEAENELLNRGDNDITAENLAEEAGLSMDEYWDAERGNLAAHQISLSELSEDGEHSLESLLAGKDTRSPGHKLEIDEVIQVVEEMLDDKEKLLIVLYYNEGLTLKEIGEYMQVSESRVCQIHTAMATRVRKKLQKIGISF